MFGLALISIELVGAVVSANATSMNMLIGGGILIGTTLSTIAIVQAIPSEVLPLKYRALANGFAFLGGAVGGLYVLISNDVEQSLLTYLLLQSRRSQSWWCHPRQPFGLEDHLLDSSCFPSCHYRGLAALLLA